MKSNHFFETERPLKLFFIVALPGMASMLASCVYCFAEGAFVGNYLGEAAFAALNLSFPLVMVNFSLADLIGVGSSSPISIALGRKDNDTANNYFSCSVIMIFVTAIIMGLAIYFLSPAFINLLGAEGELAEISVKYVRIFAIMSPATTIVFAMDNYWRICGFVKSSMVLNIFMSVVTIALLFVFLDICDMDVTGSSLASSIAMALCAAIAFVPFLLKKTVLRFVRPHFTFFMIKDIIKCGMPVFLNNIAGRVAASALNVALLSTGGQSAVATYSVLMYASDACQPILYGMSDSICPAVGYNWGAKRLDRVRDITKCCLIACCIVSILCAGFMYFFPEVITRVFVPDETSFLFAESVHGLRIFCVAFLTRWFIFAVQGFFIAIKKTTPATILSICNSLVLPIAFIFILSPMGLDGLWLNMGATSVVVSIMALIMLRITQSHMKEDIEIQEEV